mgnify:CR=1 FL=1
MIDIKFLRENPEVVKENIRKNKINQRKKNKKIKKIKRMQKKLRKN